LEVFSFKFQATPRSRRREEAFFQPLPRDLDSYLPSVVVDVRRRPFRQHPHLGEVAVGFLTPASLKTQRHHEVRTGRRWHPLPPFACSLLFCGNSPSAPLRLCASSSSFPSADGTGSSRAEALGRRGVETLLRRLLRGLAAWRLCPFCLSVKGTGGKSREASKPQRGGTGAGESKGSSLQDLP
jgi:hypothetical protein